MAKLSTSVTVTSADTFSDALVLIWADWKEKLTDTYLSGKMAELAELSDAITVAINRDRTSSVLDERDRTRDERARALFKMVDAYRYFPVAEMSEAAGSLWKILDRYGMAMLRESFAKESSLLESLFMDLAGGEAQALVAKLPSVTELVAALREAETAFKAANKDYTQSVASASAQKSATEIKRELLSLVNGEILPYLSALALADPAAYSGFASQVEAELKRANASRAASSSKKASASGASASE